MANTYVDRTGDGSKTEFTFPFKYIQEDHVKVKVDDVIVDNNTEAPTGYTIEPASGVEQYDKIVFNNAPANNAEIRIYRDSRGDFSPLVDFQDGSVLTQEPLDTAYLHNLYVSQETSEGVGGELLFKKNGVDYDAEGNKIINLGTPTASTDAANKAYTDQTIDNAIALGGSPAIVSLGGYDVTALGSTRARSLADRFADVVNLKDFGAVGNGTANDTDALKAAFTYAVNNGLKIVDKSNSTYRFTSDIIVSGANKKFELETNSTFVGESAYLYLTGSLTTIGSISAATTVGGNTFSCANASDLSEGDIVILHDHTTSSFSAHRSEYYNGEFNEVRDVSGTTVTVNGALNANYTGVSTDEVYKLNPIEVIINGGVFDTTGVYGIRLNYGKSVRLNVEKVKAENTVASAALTLNKCYDVIIEGGIFTLPYLPGSPITSGNFVIGLTYKIASVGTTDFTLIGASNNDIGTIFTATGSGTGTGTATLYTGSMYGIGVANSQNVTISSVDAYAYRHAVSTGGDDANGSVPCRNIIIKDSTLKNDAGSSVYNADFHGNTVNSIYKNCVITGGIGLAGSHVSAEDCIVYPHSGTNDIPLALHEVVGGVIKFKGCKVYSPPSASFLNVVGTASTAINANIDAAYTVHVEDLYVASELYLRRIVQAYSNSGRSNKWILNGFNIAGNISNLASIVQYNLVSPGIDADLIEIKNPRSSFNVPYLAKAGTTLSNTPIILPTQKGSNSNGEYVKFPDGTMICRFRQDTAIDIATAFLGGFRSTSITWTYPESFVDVPDVSGMPTGASASGICGSTIGSSSTSYFVLAFSSQTSATRQVHLTAIGRWF